MMASHRWIKWGVIGLVIVVLAGSAVRVLMNRNDAQRAASSAPKAQALAELASTDVVLARTRELAEGLPISGSLKAANSAFVKARASLGKNEVAVVMLTGSGLKDIKNAALAVNASM